MSEVNLDDVPGPWVDLVPAGADTPVPMSVLHSDPDTGDRTVLVEFPAGWRRDAVGNQPAQEEMVVLRGSMEISGLSVGLHQLLIGAPYVTRSATSSPSGALVLAWFSGTPGGWTEGPADPPRTMVAVDLAPGPARPARDDMSGSVEVLDAWSGEILDEPVDLLWLDDLRWCHLPAGTASDARPGRVVVKRWV